MAELRYVLKKNGEKLSVLDKVAGKGLIDVEYTLIPLAQFRIKAHYCNHCKKMIFDTNVSK